MHLFIETSLDKTRPRLNPVTRQSWKILIPKQTACERKHRLSGDLLCPIRMVKLPGASGQIKYTCERDLACHKAMRPWNDSQGPGPSKGAKKLPKMSICLYKEGRGSRKEFPSGIICVITLRTMRKCSIVKPSRGEERQRLGLIGNVNSCSAQIEQIHV